MSYPPPPDDDASRHDGPDEGAPGYQQGYGQPPYGEGQYDQGRYGQGQPYGYDPRQQPYGYDPQAQQPPYGYGQAGPYQPGYYPGGPKPEHPGAVPSLVIGLVALVGGFVCFGLPFVLGPWAWVKGRRTMQEIDASGGRLGGRGMAQGGLVCGIVATVFLVLGLLAVVAGVLLVAPFGGPPNLD